VDRRTFLTLASGFLALPLGAEAQQSDRAPHIGWLTSSVVHTRNVDAFRQGLRALGYTEVSLVFRAAAGHMDRLPSLAAELLTLGVDLLITDGRPAAFAAKHATATVPIVIGAIGGDLVRMGLIASLAHPGGNVTGFTISTGADLYGKRLELLRETMPTLSRVTIVWNPRNKDTRADLLTIETAGRTLGLRVDVIGAQDVQEVERAFGLAIRNHAGAVLMVADAFFWGERGQLVTLAARQRLPAMYPEVEFVEVGGLMAYGPNVSDNFRRAAAYVDKILKGAKPGDLPVEQPTKFELFINLKTAKALGLTIPPSVLQRADQVIE
jgi:putative tryptophan/tyrosine transport system substrate-binding protein